MSEFDDLQARLADFARRRDWEQFHNPKNLAAALTVEAGELLEIFQWLTPEQSAAVMDDPQLAAAVRDECADVLIYLARLADVLGVDLVAEANAKVDRNESRFPERPEPST
jgi:NTP pyrophosphatase (non-canonical NTP hydrolase)